MPRSDAGRVAEKVNREKENKIIHSLGLKYNMTDADMKLLLNSPYEFTYDKIKDLSLENVLTEEDLKNIKTNFYYKNLGKLFIPPFMIKYNENLRERFKQINIEKWKK